MDAGVRSTTWNRYFRIYLPFLVEIMYLLVTPIYCTDAVHVKLSLQTRLQRQEVHTVGETGYGICTIACLLILIHSLGSA